jgi:micrococcal nuclease
MGIERFDRSKRSRYRGDGILREIREAAARGEGGRQHWFGANHRFRGFTFPQRRRWRWGTARLTGLAMVMLFLATLSWLQSRDAGGGIAAIADTSWMRSGIDPPYVEPAAVEPSGMVAPSEWRGAGGVDAAAMVSARFALCHSGGGRNCVVDGDTFWSDGVKIRIADIDTPETHPARCAAEAAKGEAATRRLQALLNEAPFAIESIDRDEDRYGRKLRIVTRDGASIGGMLVSEGLARPYEGGQRQGWC